MLPTRLKLFEKRRPAAAWLSVAALVFELLSRTASAVDATPKKDMSGILHFSPIVLSGFEGEAAKYIFAPLLVPLELAGAIREEGPARSKAEKILQEGKYLAGYAVLAYAGNQLKNTYFSIDYEKYESETAAVMKAHPDKVLFLNLIDEQNKMSDYTKAMYQSQYARNPNGTYLQASSNVEMVSKLKALAQTNSFDRIEVYGHGEPGALLVGKIDKITAANVELLYNAHLQIAAPGADLRFVSCSLGTNKLTEASSGGEKLVQSLADAFLTKGGNAFAAVRNIATPRSSGEMIFEYGTGTGILKDLTEMIPGWNRDYGQVRSNFVKFSVPGAQSCGAQYRKLEAKVPPGDSAPRP